MLLQTNSYIVPKERRAEHARLLRRFRQILLRLGCDDFEVFEQMGPNWKAADATGRFVQLMRFRDRKHQRQVHAAEQSDPQAQQLINEFCDLINLPYQQQQGLLAIGYYQSVVEVPAASARGRGAAAQAEADESPEPMMGFGGFGLTGAPAAMHPVPLNEQAKDAIGDEAVAEDAAPEEIEEVPEAPAEEAYEEPMSEAAAEVSPAAGAPAAEEEQAFEEEPAVDETPAATEEQEQPALEAEAPGEELLAEEIPVEDALPEAAVAEQLQSEDTPASAEAEGAPTAVAEDVFDLDFLAGDLEPAGEQLAAIEESSEAEGEAFAEQTEPAAEMRAAELAPLEQPATEESRTEFPNVVNTAEPAIVEPPSEAALPQSSAELPLRHEESAAQQDAAATGLDAFDLEPPSAEIIRDASAETLGETTEEPVAESARSANEQSDLEALDLSDLMMPEESAESTNVVEAPPAEAAIAEEPAAAEAVTEVPAEGPPAEPAPSGSQAAETEPAEMVAEELTSLGEMPESAEEIPADLAEPAAASVVLPQEFQVMEVPPSETPLSVESPEATAPAAEEQTPVVQQLDDVMFAEAETPAVLQPEVESQPAAEQSAEAATAGTYSPLDVAHGLSDLDLDELHPAEIAPMEAMGHTAPPVESQPAVASHHGDPAMVQPGHHVPEAIAPEAGTISEPTEEEPQPMSLEASASAVVATNGEHTWHGNGLPVHLTAEEGDIEIIYEAIPEGADEASPAHS